MREKLSWKDYSNRRGLSLAYLMDSKGLHDLDSLTKYLEKLWVNPPTSEEYQEGLSRTKNYSNIQKKSVKASDKKRSGSAPKRASRRNTKKSQASANSGGQNPAQSPSEVWEDAQEGAYQAETASTKKKPATRKSTTRKTTTKKKSNP